MKSLERRFNNISQLNPYWSSYICFTEAIRSQNFSPRTIASHFKALVEKDDYNNREKKQILKYLTSLSSNSGKIVEDCIF